MNFLNKVFVNEKSTASQNFKNQYLAQPTSIQMDNKYRAEQRSTYETFRVIKDIVMSLLFIAMAGVMFFPLRFKLENIANLDELFRYLFGAICILYGLFRLYRGVKKDY